MNELDHEERNAMERLRDLDPPVGAAAGVRRALRERGLLKRSTRGAVAAARYAGGIAAAAALVVVGYVIGQGGRSAPAPAPDDRPQYVLLVREFPSGAAPAKAEAELVSEYAAWARDLGGRGALVDGWKLADRGRVLESSGGHETVADLSVKPDETVAGLFIVRAANEDEAVKLAASSPHARYGGGIEVRAIEH